VKEKTMTENTTTTVKTEPRRELEPTVFRPAVDIIEDAERVRLRLDMPGVAEGDLEITLEQNELTITGRQAGCLESGHSALRTEYDTGLFRRTFATSHLVERDGIHAHLRNGVLEVELPKRKEALPRKIPVQAG
jgi:HSP20 family protein